MLACESPGVAGWVGPRKNRPSASRVLASTLGCQLGPAVSLVDGAMCAAGRSLPDLSLAFALMAAINNSTGRLETTRGYSRPTHEDRAEALSHLDVDQ